MYNIQHSIILQNEYPTLVTVPTIHKIETLKSMRVPYVLINLAKEGVFLPKGELLGNLDLWRMFKDSYQYIHGDDEHRSRRGPKY